MMILSVMSCAQKNPKQINSTPNLSKMTLSEEEWKAKLTPEQYSRVCSIY